MTEKHSIPLTKAMVSNRSQDHSQSDPWFASRGAEGANEAAGLRLTGGGGHQSKTMMLSELTTILAVSEVRGLEEAIRAIQSENLLGKSSTAAASSALKNLFSLYGLKAPPAITRAMMRLWAGDVNSHPVLAVLCALARDPILRDTALPVLEAPVGQRFGAKELTEILTEKHADRFSFATLRSLGQNCAATWTQSGHLAGRVTKVRMQVEATPEAAAFAALISQAAGFGGPAVLSSPWMAVLDASPEEQLGLLRRAQGRGLVRVRHAGAVFELQISPELTAEFA
ncbi:hypothetical protein [Brevundimonas sp.]|uniref:hypothetical protein n=1 Tax=Brevundimonas sp. TaxID=1871086 RepID=UPI00260FC72F|nr:hypothetical protein [Brevundimonas sp.]